jgi:hypothetical protein
VNTDMEHWVEAKLTRNYLQNVLCEPVDDVAGVEGAATVGADAVGAEGEKEQCVQNVLYEPVDGAAGVAVAGADPLGAEGDRNCLYRMFSMNL